MFAKNLQGLCTMLTRDEKSEMNAKLNKRCHLKRKSLQGFKEADFPHTEALPRFQPPDKETERLCPIKAFSTSPQGIQVSHGSVRWVLSHPTLSPAPQERLGREQRRKYICDPLQMLQNSTHGLCSLHLSRQFFKGGGGS